MLISIMLCTLSVHAQQQKPTNVVVDTVPCYYDNIKNIVEIPSKTGKSVKLYAVYKTPSFEDIIPITKTVCDYIALCKDTGITPALGIKLKDGNPVSIVKYKKRIKWQK